MVLKTFCGSVAISVVLPERSDCKFWVRLSQEMRPGVFKLYMLNIYHLKFVPILVF